VNFKYVLRYAQNKPDYVQPLINYPGSDIASYYI
jgi:hypothetical protein